MNNGDELKREERELETKRDELMADKKRHEAQLVVIKNLIRTSGKMPNEKYRQCCNAQTRHVTAIAKIEAESSGIKRRLRDLVLQEFEDRQVSVEVKAVETLRLKETVQALVDLRGNYQTFAADHTRVSSMRVMAAEFVVTISAIVKHAIRGRQTG